ncbi:MAG: hypothetical protein NTV86_09810 [Planctomycetota bacterium]|nr:hypothetical protein [Planctomycetota bacterium]
MTKRQIIDEIIEINSTAQAGFLASFGEDDLMTYLARLQLLAQPRLTGDVSRYSKYFNKAAAPVAARAATVAKWHRVETLPVARPVAQDLGLAAQDAGPEAAPIEAPAIGSLFSAMA